LVWVNPIAPLQPSDDMVNAFQYFQDNHLDTLITVKNEQVHCLMDGKPLNFHEEESFAKTQDLPVVQPFVYSLMMWRTETFKRFYEDRGYAILSGKVGYYPVGRLSSIIIKREEDLRLAHFVYMGQQDKDFKIKYYGEND
jgi:CMP-N-acetylneuraminic acid synthetase